VSDLAVSTFHKLSPVILGSAPGQGKRSAAEVAAARSAAVEFVQAVHR
jgi:hypothetical protein